MIRLEGKIPILSKRGGKEISKKSETYVLYFGERKSTRKSTNFWE